MKKKDPVKEIEIQSLAAGGDGVGRINGKVCFVPYSVPGDHLQIRIIQENRSLLRGEIVAIETPGPARREPECELFGSCGGCHWLHVAEEGQLQAKRQILARALELEEISVLPSPRQLGYRKLARLHVDPHNGRLGFKKQKQNTIVDLERCPILDPALNRVLAPLKHSLLPLLDGPAEIRIALGLDGVAALVVSARALSRSFYGTATTLVPEPLVGLSASINGISTTIAGAKQVSVHDIDNAPLHVPVSSFGQANHGVNDLLGRTLRDWVDNGHYKSALELFAGAGNLTVALADSIRRVATVELDEEACRAARENLSARQVKKTTVHHGDGLDLYRSIGDRFQLAILDPPRTGHRELARALAQGKQQAIVYVSCNPATLSRDVAELKKGGYELTKALGFDMFPQTAHMEAAVHMER